MALHRDKFPCRFEQLFVVDRLFSLCVLILTFYWLYPYYIMIGFYLLFLFLEQIGHMTLLLLAPIRVCSTVEIALWTRLLTETFM